MTVSELIAWLQNMPADAIVMSCYDVHDGELYEVVSCILHEDGYKVTHDPDMQYNENIKTIGKAAAMQKFYNGVLKESEKFSGDAARAVDTLAGAPAGYRAATEQAMAAVGKGLEPVLKRLYKTGTDLAEAFAKWFGGLDAGTKA